MADCWKPEDMVVTYAAAADALDAWHAGGRVGQRPPGRLRRQDVPDLSRPTRIWSRLPLRVVQDPDGRPWGFRKAGVSVTRLARFRPWPRSAEGPGLGCSA